MCQRQSRALRKRGESVPPGPSFARNGCPDDLDVIVFWITYHGHTIQLHSHGLYIMMNKTGIQKKLSDFRASDA